MSAFTSKIVWTVLIKIQLTKSNPKRTREWKYPPPPCQKGLSFEWCTLLLCQMLLLGDVSCFSDLNSWRIPWSSTFFQGEFLSNLDGITSAEKYRLLLAKPDSSRILVREAADFGYFWHCDKMAFLHQNTGCSTSTDSREPTTQCENLLNCTFFGHLRTTSPWGKGQ